MQYKGAGFHVKEMDMKSGFIRLMASSFGNMDADGDIILQGAYSKTIRENGPQGKNRIKQLWQHDSWSPMGRPEKMEETSEGLIIEGYVSDVKNGDYRKYYTEEIITEHSVGFIPMVEEYDREKGVNYIKEVKLFEYSAVTWGANENTPVLGMKGMDKGKYHAYLVERMNTLSKALVKGNFTDEGFTQIQIAYEQIKGLVLESLNQEGPESTTSKDEPIDLVKMYEDAERNLNAKSLAELFEAEQAKYPKHENLY